MRENLGGGLAVSQGKHTKEMRIVNTFRPGEKSRELHTNFKYFCPNTLTIKHPFMLFVILLVTGTFSIKLILPYVLT